jgi:broad specificity phosphatase PhoE
MGVHLILLLVRHGNTFAKDDKVVWVGARNDLPLAPIGLLQAQELGRKLKSRDIQFPLAYCAPLRRTGDFADLILGQLENSAACAEDSRLMELDYGDWGGLTNAEVEARFGTATLKSWDEQSRWPSNAGWASNEAEVILDIRSFLSDVTIAAKSPVLVVSSNGRLRYFLKLIEGAFEDKLANGCLKMRTGACSALKLGPDSKVLFWDKRADELSAELLDMVKL